MTEKEFCARFIAEMIRIAPCQEKDRADLAGYAETIALSYFLSQHQEDDESPEDCAQADIENWEG